MMATNEELAQRIQAGERELLPELWEGVRRFVYLMANKWWRAWRESRPGLEVEELINCGYIAMCESVPDYNTERGSFLSWLKFRLLTAFSVEVGCRSPTQLNRPEFNSVSLSDSTEKGLPLYDLIEDQSAMMDYEAVEDSIYNCQARNIVQSAIRELPERQQKVIRGRYYENKTLREISQNVGAGITTVRLDECYAFRELRKNPAIRELHHGDRNLYRNTGLGSWRRTGCSVQELTLLREDRRKRRRR